MRLNRSISCKAFHSLPIIPVYLIILINVSSFIIFYAHDSLLYLYKIPVCILVYSCAFMTLYCHTISMITDPGTVKIQKERKINPYDYSNIKAKLTDKDDEMKRLFIQDEDNIKIKKHHPLICFKCNTWRPERSHHCKYCNKCVLKMDHHCPWIANCVGFYNQKSFFLFLLYATIGDLLIFLCLASQAYTALMNLVYNPMIYIIGKRVDQESGLVMTILLLFWEPFLVFIGALLSLAMGVAIGILLRQQYSNIVNNFTGIENAEYDKYDLSPWYYKGNYIVKLRSVLGFGSVFSMFYPGFIRNKYNNGVSFYVPCDNEKID